MKILQDVVDLMSRRFASSNLPTASTPVLQQSYVGNAQMKDA